ncbi:MAG: DUF488 domain-containing protein [Methanosarcinales archaeon]|nr:DUF488 domain-containing protein [Methanosarcinales archaeon]
MRIFTIGHSNRSLKELIEILRTHRLGCLLDVRSYPSSRFSPHFDRPVLEVELQNCGIQYVWFGRRLGGYRKPTGKKSPNDGWSSWEFRSYADYALTNDFADAIGEVESTARRTRTVLMCAEKMYTSCHRQIIADHLTARGWTVVHILDQEAVQPHRMTPFARVEGRQVTYPPRYEERTLDDFAAGVSIDHSADHNDARPMRER